MPKPELRKIKSFHIALDRPHRIVRSDIVLNPRRQKTRLLPAHAGLQCAIRHKMNRTPTPQPNCYSCPASQRNPGYACCLALGIWYTGVMVKTLEQAIAE